MVLIKSSVADESSADAAERLDTAFAGARPLASAVAAPASLAPPVKSASEGIHADLRFLLEHGNVGAAFIDTLEVSGILSMQEFAGLERDRTHMRDVLTGAFGLPSSSVQDLTLLSRILHVWEVSNKRVAERLLVASQYKAHQETLEMRQSDYLIYVEALNTAKGLVVADERVPGRTLLEATIEQMEEGELYPDQLSDIISRADDDKQRRAQEEEHYLGLRPDMTIRRKVKRPTGTVPKEREDVRDKSVLLANVWQMLYLRNPSRSLLRDSTPEIFSVALDFLFGEKVLGKTVKVGLGSVAPLWSSSRSLNSRFVNTCSRL